MAEAAGHSGDERHQAERVDGHPLASCPDHYQWSKPASVPSAGEYSGAPNEQQTYDYARTILKLMTRFKDPRGKVLIVGGGIANFTDVAATFKGTHAPPVLDSVVACSHHTSSNGFASLVKLC